jgi:hypothetical protein
LVDTAAQDLHTPLFNAVPTVIVKAANKPMVGCLDTTSPDFNVVVTLTDVAVVVGCPDLIPIFTPY